MADNHNKPYEYENVPLTPKSIEKLILELFGGKVVHRQVIVDEVAGEHVKRGGITAKHDITASAKKALQNLKRKGKAENPTRGYWRIVETKEQVLEELERIDEATYEEHTIEEIAKEDLSDVESPHADAIYGDGSSAVYLYYLPNYKEMADLRKEPHWPCKIGKTDRDPHMRALSQSASISPEPPHISLIIKTDDAHNLEKAIHATLALRGRKVVEAQGEEWFVTSPEEVLEIIRNIDSDIIETQISK